MVSKLTTWISGIIILLFLVSSFAVILYIPTTTNNTSSTVPSTSLVQFSGDGSSSVTINGYMSNFFVLCSNSNGYSNPAFIQSLIGNFTVPVLVNNTNSTNSSNNSSTTNSSVKLLRPFSSAITLGPTSFEGNLDSTNGTLAINQYNQSTLYFMLEAQLTPYCLSQVIPVALLNVPASPVVFQTNQTNSTPSNYTVYPLDFQGYANLVSNQNSGPASLRALVSRNTQINQTISIQANVQVINSTLNYVQIQQTGLGQNSISPTILNPFIVPVQIDSLSNQTYLALLQIPWQYRYSIASSIANSLNSSSNIQVYNYSYYPADSVLLNYTASNFILNASDLNSKLQQFNYSTANQVAPNEWILSFSNNTNASFVKDFLANYTPQSSNLVFANSTMEFNFVLNSNSTLTDVESFISAIVAVDAPLSVYNRATVTLPNPQSVSLAQQYLFPQNFTAYLNQSKVENNQSNITIQAVAYSDNAQIISAIGN